MFMVAISMGTKNGRASFDFFKFFRVDMQNLYSAADSEGDSANVEVEVAPGWACIGVGFAGG
jgi:hypothetical protein